MSGKPSIAEIIFFLFYYALYCNSNSKAYWFSALNSVRWFIRLSNEKLEQKSH